MNYRKTIKRLIYLSIILIAFSLFAPIIFTQYSIGIDFSNTGQIGDTIGGIMNPFVAIVGVISTFLAFLMQVEANHIQKEQFDNIQNEKQEREKTDKYYNLKLIELIIRNCKKDLETNIDSINQFLDILKDKPFHTERLQRTNLAAYNRLSDFNKQDIYKAFMEYTKELSIEWDINYTNMYNTVEFISGALTQVHSIADFHVTDIHKDESEIRRELIDIDEEFKALIMNHKIKSQDLYYDILYFSTEYNKITKEGGTEKQFKQIRDLLSLIIEKLHEDRKANVENFDYNYIERLRKIIIQINYIESKTVQLTESLKESVKILNKNIIHLDDLSNFIRLGIEKNRNIINNK